MIFPLLIVIKLVTSARIPGLSGQCSNSCAVFLFACISCFFDSCCLRYAPILPGKTSRQRLPVLPVLSILPAKVRKICGITTEFRQNYKKGNPEGGLPLLAQTPPTSTGGAHQIQDAGKQLPADPAVSFLAEKRPDIKKEQATPAEGWENSSGTFLKKLQHFFRKALHVSKESPTFAPAIEKQK